MSAFDKARKIIGYPHLILFRSGKIYNTKYTGARRWMSGTIDTRKIPRKDGSIRVVKYKRFSLTDSAGNTNNHYLHRLLLRHFKPNPHNKPLCDHIDGDSLNNSLANLRWTTYSENNRNRRCKGYTRGKLKKGKKPYYVRWFLDHTKSCSKTRYFTTEIGAILFACHTDFPLQRNYNTSI